MILITLDSLGWYITEWVFVEKSGIFICVKPFKIQADVEFLAHLGEFSGANKKV